MRNYRYAIALTLLILTNVQATNGANPDSLSKKNYRFFEEQLTENKGDSAKITKWANAWLEKAKYENNVQQKTQAYKALMHAVDKKFRMIYADSLLISAKSTNNNSTIAAAYLTIGAAHYNNRELEKALDYYLEANNILANTEDDYLIYKVKYTIAQTKYYLGYYDEAIALFTECIAFFKEENETGYLKSLHAIGLCYNHIERYDLCTFHNNLGIRSSKLYENLDMIPYFKNSEGINQYKLKNYDEAIKLLNESLTEIENKSDYSNQIVTWFYIGKCNWDKKDKKKAVNYFLKVHEGITATNFVRPDLRENFELVLAFYEDNKELEKQLFFIEKLLEFDKKINKEFKYLAYKIHKEYDTKTLLRTKQKIEIELSANKRKHLGILIAVLTIGLVMIGWHIQSRKRDKRKFNQIMLKFAAKSEPNNTHTATKKTNISEQVTNDILERLEKFEKGKRYLEKEMNLTKLASILNTNTKYASLIIANHRDKKSTTYINDLKIDYILKLLISNPKSRNYTNEGLAEEAGFGSTQIFTLSFKNKVGMSPTTFIHQLRKSDEIVTE